METFEEPAIEAQNHERNIETNWKHKKTRFEPKAEKLKSNQRYKIKSNQKKLKSHQQQKKLNDGRSLLPVLHS